MTTTMEVEQEATKKVAVIIERELYQRLMQSAKEDMRSGRQQLAHILKQYFEWENK